MALLSVALLAPARAATPARDDALIVVYGWNMSQESIEPYARELRERGFNPIVPDLGDMRQGLYSSALVVRDLAIDLRAQGYRSVDIVGFSAGGLTARILLTMRGTTPLIRRVVTLGAPMRGTDLRALGPRAPAVCEPYGSCGEMVPTSMLMRHLPPITAAQPRIISIWSSSDDVIVPPSSSSAPGLVSVNIQRTCPNAGTVGHLALLTDPTALALTTEALRSPRAAAPSRCRSTSSEEDTARARWKSAGRTTPVEVLL